MGQNSSSQIEVQNSILKSRLKQLGVQKYQSYHFVHKKSNQIQTVVLKNIQNNHYYILKTMTVTMEEDLISLNKLIQKRNKINSIHLCKVIFVKKQIGSLACSEINKITMLIECPIKSLRQLFNQKKQKLQRLSIQGHFQQSQLWGIAYSVIKGLKSLYLYGIVHECLDLQNIYISQKGLIKLADAGIFGLQKNYISAMKQKQNCKKILSPQILIFLQQYNFYFYQKQKSDIFIFGIILLQLTILDQFKIYDYKSKRTFLELIQINLNKVRNKYSNKFCSCLQWMTQIQPKKRPNFTELIQFIDRNNSDKSTSLSNSIQPTTTQVPTVVAGGQLKRQYTISAFSIDQKFHYQSPINNHQLSRKQIQPIPQPFTTESQYSRFYSTGKNHHNSLNNNTIPQNKKNNNQTKKSEIQNKDVFPFELVYNRIINNNDNMKKFQIQNLYKNYKNSDMFGSSCRGSIPTSSYHAKIQQSSKQIQNKNNKINKVVPLQQAKSKKIMVNEHMSYSKNQIQKNQNLIYSHSSNYNQSNKLSYSKNSLGDIKLVQSSHIKQGESHMKQFQPHMKQGSLINKNQISNILTKYQHNYNEQNQQHFSQQSPYRKLNSIKSGQGKSIYEHNRLMDIQPIIFKDNKQLEHSKFLQRYNTDNNRNINQNKENSMEKMSNRFFSQENQKEFKKKEPITTFQYYKSEYFQNKNESKQHRKYIQIHQSNIQKKYNQYLYVDEINDNTKLQKQNPSSSHHIIGSSKNVSFPSSELQSKLSRATPNFNQKSKNGTDDGIIDLKKFTTNNSGDFISIENQELIFVENDFTEQADKYTGYKNKQGLKQRHGKLEFHDGGYYQGQWKNDKMQGYGEMYYSDGSLAYKGLWKQGCFNGNGILFNDFPEKLDSPFNYRNFAEIQNKWICYQGQFQMDSKHGKGKIRLTNGQHFEGTFDYDMIQGYGTFYSNEGAIVKGQWRDNQFLMQC